MTLAAHQRAVRDLLVATAPTATGDPYAVDASGSEAVALVRDIAASWRHLGIARACPLTVAVLRQRDGLDEALAAHDRCPGHSPFLEVLAQQFLGGATRHRDALVAAMARFELAVHRARTGAATAGAEVIIDWPCPPADALQAVVDGRGAPAPSGWWRMRAPALEPQRFAVEPLAHAGGPASSP